MPRSRLILTLALCGILATLFATGSEAALVRVNDLILHADGGFQPNKLPRRQFIPIDFQGYVDIAAKDGGQPSALQQAVVEFDRDGRLSTSGLPVCQPATVASASTSAARQACGGAMVGTGRIQASIDLGGVAVGASSPLTIFNGPPLAGNPTVVLHARTTLPSTETYAILVPVERRHGAYGYRATLDVPPIAGGLGAITRVEVKIGRRFVSGGQQRSYVSARCSTGVLRTHGRFTFADGTIIEGDVEKGCTQR